MSSPYQSRRELEDFWRIRLKTAQIRYQAARAETTKAAQEQSAGFTPSPDGEFAWRHALQIETAALQEFNRLLRIFTDLTIHGKIPRDLQ